MKVGGPDKAGFGALYRTCKSGKVWVWLKAILLWYVRPSILLRYSQGKGHGVMTRYYAYLLITAFFCMNDNDLLHNYDVIILGLYIEREISPACKTGAGKTGRANLGIRCNLL